MRHGAGKWLPMVSLVSRGLQFQMVISSQARLQCCEAKCLLTQSEYSQAFSRVLFYIAMFFHVRLLCSGTQRSLTQITYSRAVYQCRDLQRLQCLYQSQLQCNLCRRYKIRLQHSNFTPLRGSRQRPVRTCKLRGGRGHGEGGKARYHKKDPRGPCHRLSCVRGHPPGYRPHNPVHRPGSGTQNL